MSKVIRSALSYQGNKFRLIPEIKKRLPEGTSVFLDVFGGSSTVCANVDFPVVRYNELDSNVFNIIRMLRDTPTQELIYKYNKVVSKFGLGKGQSDSYYKFREDYNKNPSTLKLFVLSKHSFSSLMRFSGNGFDMPFGDRGGLLSSRMEKSINQFQASIANIKMSRLGAASFVKKCISKYDPSDTVFYFDPPYLASGANVYRFKWTSDHEKELLKLLGYLDKLGYKFILSNVIRHGKRKNNLLKHWMKQYNVTYPVFTGSGEGYVVNRAAKREVANNTIEVLVTNY
tara:strand:- start:4025 stop:4882 length:858 start_codon:yes stop_codon:yes gene_type:complete